MKILVTGAKGFIGKNLIAHLANYGFKNIMQYDIDSAPALLDSYCQKAQFVFNLAGVNRPQDPAEFLKGNFGFASTLLDTLQKHENTCPVMLSSSTQALLDNPYGQSKKAGENLFFVYGRKTGARVLVYRFPNVFGKWCRPNYNSAVATFCHNTANALPIQIHDRSTVMTLVYIDDVMQELFNALRGNENRQGIFCEVPVTHTVTLGKIADLLREFKKSRQLLTVPNMADEFSKKLYSTYLSYLPQDQFSYTLPMNIDNHGSLLSTP